MKYSCNMSALLMFLLFVIIRIINKTGGHFASCREIGQG